MKHGGTGQQLSGRRVEVLFVDDSDDDTVVAIGEVIGGDAGDDRAGSVGVTVRVFHRAPDRRWGGLGGAVVDGFGQARGAVAVVMDGDLQHPADRISSLVAMVDSGSGVAIASRRVHGGSDDLGLTPTRRRLSVTVAGLSRRLFPGPLGRVTDPLSGFFAVRLGALDLNRLHPDGFKILVEVLATHPKLSVSESPFRFVGRTQGMSKASASEGARFFGHLIDLRIRTSRVWAGAPVPQRVFPSTVRKA